MGGWRWGLYAAKGGTPLGRKEEAANTLMSDKRGAVWSLKQGARFVECTVEIQNAGVRGDTTAMREPASYLPLQPRRLARCERALAQSATPAADERSMATIMAELGEIKRALNGASLLSKA